MSDHEQRSPSGVRQPSHGDAAGGGEAEAAKLSAEEPRDADLTGPSEDAPSDIEERRTPHEAGEQGRKPEDAPPS